MSLPETQLQEPRHHREGLSLVGTLGVVGLAVMILTAVTWTTDWIRTDLKSHQTRELLSRLDAALRAYHQATGRWPSLPAGPEGTPPAAGRDLRSRRPVTRPRPPTAEEVADTVIAALAELPASHAILEQIAPTLRTPPRHNPIEASAQKWGSLQDSWARRLQCATLGSPALDERQLAAANGGCPVFMSAGPDGRFGKEDLSQAADNLYLQPDPSAGTPASRPTASATTTTAPHPDGV